jgi:hypothetical protein
MSNLSELNKVKSTSKHFSKIVILEFGYCFVIYFSFKLLPFLNHKTLDIQNALTEILIYLSLLYALPLIYNVFKIIQSRRIGEYGKLNNYILCEFLIIILVYKFLV